MAYLMICQKQYEDRKYEGYYNVGPDETDCVTTGHLVDVFCEKWRSELLEPDHSSLGRAGR